MAKPVIVSLLARNFTRQQKKMTFGIYKVAYFRRRRSLEMPNLNLPAVIGLDPFVGKR